MEKMKNRKDLESADVVVKINISQILLFNILIPIAGYYRDEQLEI